MLRIHDKGFRKYGLPLEVDATEAIEYLKKLELPPEGNIYRASDPAFERIPLIQSLGATFFGGPFQAGYVNGRNAYLNCAEYHDCPEINIAAEDATLFLATLDQIKDGKIDSSSFEEVLLKKGDVVLIYPSVLHFSPCLTSPDGFHVAVILSKGTNLDLTEKPDSPLYWKKNKWLLAHPESKQARDGAYVGIVGENRRGGLAP